MSDHEDVRTAAADDVARVAEGDELCVSLVEQVAADIRARQLPENVERLEAIYAAVLDITVGLRQHLRQRRIYDPLREYGVIGRDNHERRDGLFNWSSERTSNENTQWLADIYNKLILMALELRRQRKLTDDFIKNLRVVYVCKACCGFAVEGGDGTYPSGPDAKPCAACGGRGVIDV